MVEECEHRFLQVYSMMESELRLLENTQSRVETAGLNFLTFDVEEYHQAENLRQAPIPHSWTARENRAERGTRRVLELLHRSGVRATFFVLGWLAEHFPHLVREIHDAGHEVATHGYSHRSLRAMGPRIFTEELRRSQGILSDLSGERVLGHRAANFSLTRETWWALDILGEQGVRYDSSLFPVSYGGRGVGDSPSGPFLIEGSLVEFPVPAVSIWGWRLPVVGGGFLRLYPYALTRWAARKITTGGNPVLVYLHPWELDPGQPRLRISGVRAFRHYLNLARTETKLSSLLRDFGFSPLREGLRLFQSGAAQSR